MKLLIFTYTVSLVAINCFLVCVNGQYGNNPWGAGGNGQQANPFVPAVNRFQDNLRNHLTSNLFRTNGGFGGGGSGPAPFPNQLGNPYQQQHQGGFPNQYPGNPAFQNQAYNPNQGQYGNNPNAYQQQGGSNYPPNQQQAFQGPQNYSPNAQLPVQQPGSNFPQQNFQQPQGYNANAQPPVLPRENLAPQGQGDLPVPQQPNSQVPSENNVQTNPAPNPQSNDIPPEARLEANAPPNEAANPAASDTNAEDALILKDFNNTA